MKMIVDSRDMENKAIMEVAALMCLAARTAPKGRGTDNLVCRVVSGEDLTKLAAEMKRYGEEHELPFFVRDSGNMSRTQVVVLLGTRMSRLGLQSCNYCGHEGCQEAEKAGVRCAFNAGDLGIAIGSAVSVAANHRADCRVMYTAGRAALNLGLLGEEVKIAYGIPLAAGSKNPYFDR
jgi:uncharacterized ferredoxin-like protein